MYRYLVCSICFWNEAAVYIGAGTRGSESEKSAETSARVVWHVRSDYQVIGTCG